MMASYKATWIVGLVSVLVGCALTSAGASTRGADMELISRIDDANSPLKPEQLKDILQKHGNQDFKIDRFTVKTLVESCTPSLGKCTWNEFYGLELLEKYYTESRSFYYRREVYYGEERDQKLRDYTRYCWFELQKFCAENFDDVKKSFLAGLDNGEKKLARSFMNILHKIWPHNKMPEDKYIVRAYEQLRNLKPRVETERMNFRFDFREVFSKFRNIYLLSSSQIGNLPSEYESSHALRKRRLSTFLQASPSTPRSDIGQLSPGSSSPDDILMTQWWKTCAAGYKIMSLFMSPGSLN